MSKVIKKFKVDNQEYELIENEGGYGVLGVYVEKYYTIDAPQNALGYRDVIMLDYAYDKVPYVYALHQRHSKKALNRCLKEFLKLN